MKGTRPQRRRWPDRFTTAGLAAALAFMATVGPGRARAEDATGDSADVERAKAWFKAGATAYASGDYLAAIQALEAAYRITPLPPIAFSLAQAERRQYFAGHDPVCLTRAIALYRRYVNEVPAGGRRGDALDALGQLEPLSASLSPKPESPREGSGSTSASTSAETRPKTRLLITAEAPDARVSLDGDPEAASPLIREVEPGPHRVRVTAPGYVADERDVVAVEGELVPVAVGLHERPSTLRVEVPGASEIYVDGLFAGRANGLTELPVASGTHRLAIAQRGHRVFTEDLSVAPGEERTVAARLEPTRQRRVATAFFVAGSVAFGTALVTGGLALSAQNTAEDFLRRQAAGNVSSEDLRAYQSDVRDRNRYRTATTVAAGFSFALLATGLFLHLVDTADPEELRGGSAGAGRTGTPQAPRPSLVSRMGFGLGPAGEVSAVGATAFARLVF